MAYEVVWSASALEDVESLAEYISRDSEYYARSVVEKILAQTRKLKKFPMAGRIVPELDDKFVRETFVYSYRIIYRLQNQRITILAGIHGKRLLDSSPDNSKFS